MAKQKNMSESEAKYIERAFHTTLAKSIISNQFAVNLNDQLRHSKFYKSDVKVYGKPFINALIKAEKKEFNKVDNTDTNAVDHVFEQIDALFLTLACCPFIDYGEAKTAIQALARNPKKLMKTVNEILCNTN